MACMPDCMHTNDWTCLEAPPSKQVFQALQVVMAPPPARVDNLLSGCLSPSADRPTLLRIEADFVTCTQ